MQNIAMFALGVTGCLFWLRGPDGDLRATLAAFGGPLIEAIADREAGRATTAGRATPDRDLKLLWITPLRALARSGVGIIVISSDVEELAILADRVLVMREGRLTGELTGSAITEANIIELSYQDEDGEGGNAP